MRPVVPLVYSRGRALAEQMQQTEPSQTIVIFGCGYTGRRVAKLLLARGHRVIATTRSAPALCIPGLQVVELDVTSPADLAFVPAGARVLYSIPPVGSDATKRVASALANNAIRIVYLSTTGVYGAAVEVDSSTAPAPRRPEDDARLADEQIVTGGIPSSVVLRPAAIYGPGRGVHVSMRASRFHLSGDGTNFVSRIYVDDLARHVEAALFHEISGAWPVADNCPARSRDVAEFCSKLLGLPMPGAAEAASLHHTRQANRRVDGSAIRMILGVKLSFSSYREGIPAALEAEQQNFPL